MHVIFSCANAFKGRVRGVSVIVLLVPVQDFSGIHSRISFKCFARLGAVGVIGACVGRAFIDVRSADFGFRSERISTKNLTSEINICVCFAERKKNEIISKIYIFYLDLCCAVQRGCIRFLHKCGGFGQCEKYDLLHVL